MDETLGFPPLIKGQFLTSVLTIEQTVQAFVYSPWKLEAIQILGKLELEENLLRHADPFKGGPPDLHSTPRETLGSPPPASGRTAWSSGVSRRRR